MRDRTNIETIQAGLDTLTDAINYYVSTERNPQVQQAKEEFFKRLISILREGAEGDLREYLMTSKTNINLIFRDLRRAVAAYNLQNPSYTMILNNIWKTTQDRIERATAIAEGLEVLEMLRGQFSDEEWEQIEELARSTATNKPAPNLVLCRGIHNELIPFVNSCIEPKSLVKLRSFFVAVLPQLINADPGISKGFLHLGRINAVIAEKLWGLEQTES